MCLTSPGLVALVTMVASAAHGVVFAHPAWPHFAHLIWPHLMLIFCLGRSVKSSERIDRKLRTVRRWKPASEADASNAGVQLARNSWSQTHQDDETRGEARTCFAPILKANIGLIDLPMP
jgi:hypothetical protein